ncbi:MAG: TetR/AcrR family transcriptional regulator [Verrucomicrobiota bacterium]
MLEKRSDARQLVLESAIAEFAKKGYAGTSVQDILRATRLSKPTLYYYFKSKAGLFRAILGFAYDESFRLMQAGVEKETSCEERLIEVASAVFAFARNHQSLIRLVFATVFAAPEEIPPDSIDSTKRRRNFEFVLKIVRGGQKGGELDSRYDPVELTHGIFGAISHQTRTHLLEAQGSLDRRRAERVVSLFLDGARKQK